LDLARPIYPLQERVSVVSNNVNKTIRCTTIHEIYLNTLRNEFPHRYRHCTTAWGYRVVAQVYNSSLYDMSSPHENIF